MNIRRLDAPNLALSNISRKPVRTAGLAVIVAVFAFMVFCGTMLTQSLKTGIDSMAGRLGADLMVVPEGSDGALENFLLRSEPSTFYFQDDIIKKLETMDGVSVASGQLFIASLDAACCTVPVQLIGYEPETDFTITPWMVNSMDNPLAFGDVVVGNLVQAEKGDEVIFYGQPFKVVTKLGKTGTGFDSSIFMTTDTARHMIELSGQNAVHPAGDGQGMVSSVFLKLEKDADIHEMAERIKRQYPDTEIVVSDDFMRGISKELSRTGGITLMITALLWVAAVLVLLFVFSITFNERKKEFALLIVLGANRKKIASVIICEALMVTIIGTVCGLFIACLVMFPFQTLIATSLGVPYLMPQPLVVVGDLLISAGISIVMGPVSCFYSAIRMSRTDTYFTLRENE